jgi:F420-0:gamma-glutamyl ligase
MQIQPIKTRPLLPPQDDIFEVLDQYVDMLSEGDVLCITSKVLAIHQGRCVQIQSAQQKKELVIQEADRVLAWQEVAGHEIGLTIKNHTLIPSSGIDESNSDGYAILWPEQQSALCAEIRSFLTKKFGIEDLGIIATDSRCIPLRKGVVGISTGAAGFQVVEDLVGAPDIFGRPLAYTSVNIVDSLAATAVFAMGESNECTPLVVLRDIPKKIVFGAQYKYEAVQIAQEDDLFAPLWEIQ